MFTTWRTSDKVRLMLFSFSFAANSLKLAGVSLPAGVFSKYVSVSRIIVAALALPPEGWKMYRIFLRFCISILHSQDWITLPDAFDPLWATFVLLPSKIAEPLHCKVWPRRHSGPPFCSSTNEFSIKIRNPILCWNWYNDLTKQKPLSKQLIKSQLSGWEVDTQTLLRANNFKDKTEVW